MRTRPLALYFAILFVIGATFAVGARIMGQQGAYLAQGYMLTPAIAAVLTRLFFYPPGFSDANLRLGRASDYLRFWALSLGITALSYGLYTLLGAIQWDFTGDAFLDRLSEQFAMAGQDMNAALPPGFTPRMMLMVYFAGGLTIFNILPGIITGFGEEFGHRGLMFPLLYRYGPWIAFVVGGLIWYAWHLPLSFVLSPTAEHPLWQTTLNHIVLAVGSVFAFTYLAYIYVKSESVFVTSVAHATMNNAAMAFGYFAIIQNQLLANLGLAVTMMIVVIVLWRSRELEAFARYFAAGEDSRRPSQPEPAGSPIAK